MTVEVTPQIHRFREKLRQKSRDEILSIIGEQNPKYIKHINRIEQVFREELRHLNWLDGSPVTERDFTLEELILLVDPPFIFDPELAKLGVGEDMQRYAHIASDPVLWSKYFLQHQPRAYQALILRDPNTRKVMRFGRRLGKTKTMAFYSLWFSYVVNNAKILIVAPMMSQVGLIFDEIITLAKQNDLILNKSETGCAITRHVKSPHHEIQFDNGSTIRFFSTGMKSNNKTDVARGQEADIIICDEMDYMGPEDLDALLAMLQQTSEEKGMEKSILGASTPSGQRNKFWDWSTNPKFEFSSYWFPSYVNPGWDEKTERMMRIDYPNDTAYRHEIEADWGEDEMGVYPIKFVQQARVNPGWDYSLREPKRDDSFFVFGVDWDKYTAGVNIVILEMCGSAYSDPEYANKIKLVYREETKKDEFIYIKAQQRIIDLNEIFHPRHIYVDRGAGEVQVEFFHDYGRKNPHTGLHKSVKGVQFAETIIAIDPASKEEVKRDIKPFMVDTLRKYLEREMFAFPQHDEELFVALISYIIARISATTGRPVFAAGGKTTDHAHDALILACHAIADNYEEILNPIYTHKAIPISNEVFLSTFDIQTEEERDFVEDKWGKGNHGPVTIRRPLTGIRRGGNGGMTKRKMF